MAFKMKKMCIIIQIVVLLLGVFVQATSESKKDGAYDKIKDQQDKIHSEMDDFVWDARPNTTFEKVVQWIWYLPLSLAWFVFTAVSAFVVGYTALKYLCRKEEATDDEIKFVDNHSLNNIKLANLHKLNKARGDKQLSFGMFMQSYIYLNWRTDFEADDVFSQKSAILAHIHRIRTNKKSFVDGKTDIQEDEDEDIERMTKETQRNISKAISFKYMLTVMCLLSLFTSSLALSMIFDELLVKQTRKVVLSSFGNAILRLCFGAIILCIAQRDILQIIINLSVRLTGAVSEANNSRWIFIEAILRISITTLALITILFVVFSTPKDEYEGIVDQTMNFTALVILLEIDNILASVYQAKIDNLKIDFELHQDTLEFEFNRCADFLQGRRDHYYCQYFLELLFLYGFGIVLFMVILILPIFVLMLYVVIPPHAKDMIQ